MTNQEFNTLVDNQFKYCKQLLDVKGKEYAPDTTDRLSAFKTASHVLHKTPIQALGGQMSKHTISIYELIDNGCTDMALWQEKITDSINYHLLLKALITETAHNASN
jgi:hypothetical protein